MTLRIPNKFGLLFLGLLLAGGLFGQIKRFPKASIKLSVLVPEVALESSSKSGGTFNIGLGYAPSRFENDIIGTAYLHIHYRRYLYGPDQQSDELGYARGFYLFGGAFVSAYTWELEANRGTGILALGAGYQIYANRLFFFDAYLGYGAGLQSAFRGYEAVPSSLFGLRAGLELESLGD